MESNVILFDMKRNVDLGLVILRVAVGLLMLLHGIAKLKGIPFIENLFVSRGLPSFLAYGVYITEIIAPLIILIGYRTRIASAVYVLGVLIIIFMAHPGDILTLNQHGGWAIELLGLFLLGGVALFFTGAGKYALSSKSAWD